MKFERRIALCLLLAVLLAGFAAAQDAPLTQAEGAIAADGTLPATCAESALGELLADCALEATGADVAILPAACMQGTLGKGAVFASDLERVIPEDVLLVTLTVSPAALTELLEQGIGRIVTDKGERIDTARSASAIYPQVAGFTWEYDASAPAGERVTRIEFGGGALDLTDGATALTLVTVVPFPGADAGRSAGVTLREAAARYCAGRELISAPERRTTVIGTASYPLIDRFPILGIVIAVILMLLLSMLPRLKHDKYFSFRPRLSDYKKAGGDAT